MERNLTSGSVIKNILTFALPYFLSYFLQTLYGMADLYIVGQFNGVAAITGVSNGSQVMNIITVVIVGLAMGATVMIGRAVGAKKPEDAEKAVGNTVTFFMGIAIVFTLVLIALRYPIIRAIGVPKAAVSGTVDYITICFIGIICITAYNIISAIFRGLGDSKSPMIFVAVACAVNIGLDYLFIGGFDMGPAGAALGTSISQGISVVVSLIAIKKSKTGLKLKKEDFRLKKAVLGPILNVGVPVAVQDGCIQVAFIIITVIANYRGLTDAAAVGIVEKLIGMIFIVPSSMLATVSALAAQNIGAGKYGRAVETLRDAALISVAYGIVITIIVQFNRVPLLSLFTSDKVVVAMGATYLASYIFDVIVAGIHFCFSGYFAAYGKSYIGFIHNIAAIALVRVPGSYIASKMYPDTLFPMGWASPAGSVLSVIICVTAFIILKKKGAIITKDITPET